MHRIKISTRLVEAGSHLSISKMQMEISDLINLKIEESDFGHFGKELQTELVPEL